MNPDEKGFGICVSPMISERCLCDSHAWEIVGYLCEPNAL